MADTVTPEERLQRIAAWYVFYRNDEGAGYAPLDGMFEMLGMTQDELTAAYYGEDRMKDWEEARRQWLARVAQEEN